MIQTVVMSSAQNSYAGLFGLFEKNIINGELIKAVETGDFAKVQNLIQRGHPLDIVGKNGQTALMRAAENGNSKIANALIKAGARVNVIDSHGRNALHLAAKNGHIEISNSLISKGIDTTLVDKYGMTAFKEAVKHGNVSIAKAINPSAITAVSTEASFPAVAAASSSFGGFSGTTVATAAGTAAAAGGAAAAVGGSGGGGGGESSSDSSSDSSNNSGSDSSSSSSGGSSSSSSSGSASTPSASDFETFEYFFTGTNSAGTTFRNYNLGAVNASTAYFRGYTGSGAVVAVVDTGVDLGNTDLDGNIVSGGGRSFFNNGSEGGNGDEDGTSAATQDNTYWHGTHVAGIIAAEKNNSGTHGIAYDAKILPVNVYSYTDKQIYDVDIAAGIDYAVSKNVNVINLSLGGGESGLTNTIASLKSAVTKDILIAAATGNLFAEEAANAELQPIFPAALAGDSTVNKGTPGDGVDTGGENIGALIAVGATDSSNNLASFSHHCGAAQEWCMVAPGVLVISTFPENGLQLSSGTSMAAPHIAGAAAILKDAFSHLSSREIAEILLNTATDLGAAGVDSVYGHGLLNLSAATEPLGTTSVPTGASVSSNSFTVSSSNINLSAAFGDAISTSSTTIGVLDDYKRLYNVELSSLTHSSASITADDMFADFAEPLIRNRNNITENMSFAFESVRPRDEVDIKEPDYESNEYSRASFTVKSESSEFSVNYNIAANKAFGTSALQHDYASNLLSDTTAGNPVLGLVQRGLTTINRIDIDDKHSLNMASFSGEQENVSGNISGFVGEILYNTSDNLKFSFQAGYMFEDETFMGSAASGAFQLDDGVSTLFYNIATDFNLGNGINIFGSYNVAESELAAAEDSILSDVSNITFDSFSLGIAKHSSFSSNDIAGFVISQPLRAKSGNVTITAPISRNIDGDLFFQTSSISLSPTGREIDLEAFYSFAINNASSLKTSIMHRTQPGHIENAESESIFAIKFVKNF